MDFKYDPRKSQANKAKHGIDFIHAQDLWEDPGRVNFIARFQDEDRFGLVASHDGHIWCAIYTTRDFRIRIISVRKARDYEKDIYNQS